MQTYIIIALVSYLLGSIPFGYILVRLFLKQDIRQTGSGNIGATNVARSGAKGLAIATLFLDALKGFSAVVAVALLFPNQALGPHIETWIGPLRSTQPQPGLTLWPGLLIAGLFAILGHMFPVWLRFKGGKGVATAVGVFLALAPIALLISLLAFTIVVALTRYVSLGSIVAAVVFPVAAYVSERELQVADLIAIVAGCSLLIILKHHANIRRLLAGTEPKFGAKSTIPPPHEMEKQA
jgi:glycerol-3-phosphate acyltransferase PlsY